MVTTRNLFLLLPFLTPQLLALLLLRELVVNLPLPLLLLSLNLLPSPLLVITTLSVQK